jgi:inhibitor of the pro-sigma K processing machinery
MTMDYKVMIAYILGIILLFLLGRLLVIPLKAVLKLVLNAVIGGIVLIVINFIGELFRYHIALNIISALIVGLLGIPGVLLLVVLKLIFHA